MNPTIKKGKNGKLILEFEAVIRIPVKFEAIKKVCVTDVFMSASQKVVFDGAVQGLSNKAIAEMISRSERVVKFHISNLLKKFHVKSRYELAALALGQERQ